jgi:hypothetical protein
MTLHDWLERTILPLNLCPFAHTPFKQGLVRLYHSEVQTPLEAQRTFLNELERLIDDSSAKIATTLIGFTRWDISFEDYLDFVFAMEELVEEAGLAGMIQLVTFHPHFRLRDFPDDSFAHWPNSSPFPVLHLLRSHDVAKAAQEAQGKKISETNEARILALSLDERRQYFPWKFIDA